MRRILAQTNILAVGEGQAELQLLLHLKRLYLPRNCGTTVKLAGGYGKGGKGVVDYAERYADQREYTRVVLLLDTDADWDDRQRKRAVGLQLEVVESVPCLESWLLALHGDQRERNTDAHKREFQRRFGVPAHDARCYADNFSRQVLDAARQRVAPLRELLRLFDVA